MKASSDTSDFALDMIIYSPTPEALACWRCGKDIPLENAHDACPFCGGTLTESACDDEARERLLHNAALASTISDLSQQLETAKRQNKRLGILRRLPIFPSRRRITHLSEQLEKARTESQAITASLRELATVRYYISRWYQRTHIPLCDLGNRGDTPFGAPRYQLGRRGAVRFECKTTAVGRKRKKLVDARYAEYEAFCALQRIADTGALGHARVLANLVIPYDNDEGQRYQKRIRSNEIDALLITERAVIVIEVKRGRRAAIVDYRAQQHRHHVALVGITRSGEYFGGEQEDWSVRQVASHCRTLDKANVYSIDNRSIVGLVIYVDTPRVNVRCEQGEGPTPMYFASLHGMGPDLKDVLVAAVNSKPTVRSAAEVDAVTEEAFARFADLDGSKLREHRKRLEREQAQRGARPFHKPSSQKRRATQPDKELERMLRNLR
ncbi:nuclease-related domain-containing protein [Collinsella sp. An2]|uniref:nuclease-related domain-containing protein n=1 Tax=Collinsella sp. An2 TaxID=1965585 RepID=UPI0013029199|nr:nuclease-related domain-containing protein [Collinsella sp. An2]